MAGMVDAALWAIPVVLALVLGVPPLWFMWRSRRSHVRSVWARIEPLIADDGEWLEGRLTITNGSAWPVRNAIVLHPEDLAAEDFESVGPGETRTRRISASRLLNISDQMLTVQIEDTRHRTWLWTPIAGVISPIPPPITPLARLLQPVARLPERAQARFARLPYGAPCVPLGYDRRRCRRRRLPRVAHPTHPTSK